MEFYTQFLKNEKNEKEAEQNQSKGVFKAIFDIHPNYKDANLRISLCKAIFLIIIGIGFAVCVYFLSHNVYLSLGLALFIVIAFSVIFHEAFFSLVGLFRFQSFNPFKELVFWMIEDDNETFFYTNKVDLLTTGLRIFEIEIQPETIHANMRQFLKTFQVLQMNLPFSYQVVHRNTGDKIFITVFDSWPGRLNENKVKLLQNKLRSAGARIHSAFASNFRHFQTKHFRGHELVNAFRCTMLHKNIDEDEMHHEAELLLIGNKRNIFLKFLFILGLLAVFTIFFIILVVPAFYILLIDISILIAHVYLFMREFLFHISKNNVFGYKNVITLNPFHDIKFLYSSKSPHLYYTYVRNHEISGIIMSNVTDVVDPPYCSFAKFLSGILAHKLPFTYTVVSNPVSYAEFYKECRNNLKENLWKDLSRSITREIDAKKWLGYRGGMWKSTILLSTSHSVPVKDLTTTPFNEIAKCLYESGDTVFGTFHTNFSSYELSLLSKRKLRSGVMCELLKNTNFRFNGSHLQKVYFQGTTLAYIIHLADELKKGMEVQVAAKFNTPTYLKNDIIFGKTINTENNILESQAGLLLDQLRSLLITCGTIQHRNFLTMKIVSELIKKNIPSIIFDISGNWGKLLTYFRGTKYIDNILYFKLGKAFTLDPIHSETMPNDPNNLHYLQYMYDAYQFTLKINKHIMNNFRSFVRKHQSVDIKTIRVDINSQQPYERDSDSDSLLAYLEYFSPEDLAFFHATAQPNEERIKAHEFITTPHTIIVDMSDYPDHTKQCFYLFVVLSKFIHYISNNTQFVPKYLFIPHVDIIFEEKFLDANGEYSKINKFFSPLLQKKFGIVCLCNNVHYLHSNVFSFTNNIITFQSIDQRDTSTLANRMNLNELHGTGYYNTKRKETYQIAYLKSLKGSKALMKRADIYQVFPILIDGEEIARCPPMEYHDIVLKMQKQGYDLKYSEQRILAQAKKNLFEKDFAEYYIFINEIINFFNIIKTVDKIGGLYIKQIRKTLMECLSSKIELQFGQNRTRMKVIRDSILRLMVEHDYLVESHPRTAGGGEQMATSYAVSPKYDKALSDYYESQQVGKIEVNILSTESNIVHNFIKASSKLEKRLQHVLDKNLGTNTRMELFHMHEAITKKDYHNFMKFAKYFVIKFITKVYRDYYNPANTITKQDIEEFLDFLTNTIGFPYTISSLNQLIKESEDITIDSGVSEQQYIDFYPKLEKFYIKIKNFVEES